MSEFVQTYRIRVPESCEDPIGELEIFLRVNGYTSIVDEQTLSATRGEKGKGFWTSDLTVLPTQLDIQLDNDFAVLKYCVLTTGQILSAAEKEFWQLESRAAGAFLTGEPLENFKEAQKFRASEIRAGFVKKGAKLAVFTAFVLFIVGFMLLK